MPFTQSGPHSTAIFNGDYNDVRGNQDNRHTKTIGTIRSAIYFVSIFIFFRLIKHPSRQVMVARAVTFRARYPVAKKTEAKIYLLMAEVVETSPLISEISPWGT